MAQVTIGGVMTGHAQDGYTQCSTVVDSMTLDSALPYTADVAVSLTPTGGHVLKLSNIKAKA